MRNWFTGLFTLALAPCLAFGAAPAPTEKSPAPGKAFVGVALGATAKDAAKPGVVVRDVTPDSPAAKAGLQKGS